MRTPFNFSKPRASLPLFAFALLFAVSCYRQSSPKPTTSQAPAPVGNQTITGRIVRIADGDTVTVLDATNTQHRIRLQGIDAPESHQAFGTQSKKSLSDMIFDKDVTVIYDKTDQYGRLVGKILLNGKDVNLEQVKAGMAWHYKEYEREQSPEDRELYARAEDEARSARRGLWVDASPTEPASFAGMRSANENDDPPQRTQRKTNQLSCAFIFLGNFSNTRSYELCKRAFNSFSGNASKLSSATQ
ncbi:MAG TPA: thermonuclease family protein [Pyrinomonadaceae bacterium]|jgi:endonuclease YncB( thermonuclease family)